MISLILSSSSQTSKVSAAHPHPIGRSTEPHPPLSLFHFSLSLLSFFLSLTHELELELELIKGRPLTSSPHPATHSLSLPSHLRHGHWHCRSPRHFSFIIHSRFVCLSLSLRVPRTRRSRILQTGGEEDSDGGWKPERPRAHAGLIPPASFSLSLLFFSLSLTHELELELYLELIKGRPLTSSTNLPPL